MGKPPSLSAAQQIRIRTKIESGEPVNVVAAGMGLSRSLVRKVHNREPPYERDPHLADDCDPRAIAPILAIVFDLLNQSEQGAPAVTIDRLVDNLTETVEGCDAAAIAKWRRACR